MAETRIYLSFLFITMKFISTAVQEFDFFFLSVCFNIQNIVDRNFSSNNNDSNCYQLNIFPLIFDIECGESKIHFVKTIPTFLYRVILRLYVSCDRYELIFLKKKSQEINVRR